MIVASCNFDFWLCTHHKLETKTSRSISSTVYWILQGWSQILGSKKQHPGMVGWFIGE